MGRGVFSKGPDSLTFIIDHDQYMPDELTDHDLARMYFDDMVHTILGALPRSYDPCLHDNIWDDRYTRIIARNGFVNVGLTEWECNDLFVSFWPRDDRYDDCHFEYNINPLAYHAYESAHHRTAAALQRAGFDLRVRTSGYTTAPMANHNQSTLLTAS
jgi:hypothetical protein